MWKKDAKEFTAKVTHHETRGHQMYVPKPVMEKLGNPKALKFVFTDHKIEVHAGMIED
jgi:hypothetical protein